jgi:hypothetical protein
VPAAAGYDHDFFEWTQHTAALLRAGRLGELDVVHLAEEVEEMGKRDRRELESRLQVLLVHLLKWGSQAERRSPSWRRTIIAQRAGIERVLRDSPSLRPRVAADLERHYADAVDRAAIETELPPGHFPARCPWTSAELLDKRFFPA